MSVERSFLTLLPGWFRQFIKNTKYTIGHLRFQRPLYVSIEINSLYVQAIVVGVTKSNLHLLDCHTVILPEGALKGTQINNYKVLAETLITVKSAIKSCPDFSAINFCGNGFILKTLQFEGELTEQEITSKVEDELQNNMPYNVDNMAFDFHRIKPASEDVSTQLSKTEVLLGVAQRSQIDEWKYLLSDNGLPAVLIDYEGTALLTYLQYAKSNDEAVACFHIGTNHSIFTVLNNKQRFFVKELNFGTDNFISALALRAAIYQTNDINEQALNLQVDCSNLVQQIKTLLTLCNSEIAVSETTRIHLSGIDLVIEPLCAQLQMLGINATLVTPIDEFFDINHVGTIKNTRLRYAFTPLFGLALRGVEQCHI